MVKLSKTESAKRIGVSRATLYSYIKKGRISTDPDGTIDTAELLRAGFTLRPIDSDQTRPNGKNHTDLDVLNPEPQVMSKRVESLEAELSTLRQQLADAQFQNKKLTDDTTAERARLLDLLEHEQQNQRLLIEASPRSPWWRVWRKG